jgi:predicted HAD superfamily Cof-like phosphohydrolase
MTHEHRVDLFKQVLEFHEKFAFANFLGPNHLSVRERRIRVGMMLEELKEYVTAATLEDELDALVDLVVFALGTAVRHGFTRFDEAFERVMRANMQKERGESGDRDEFEFLKPEGWKAPDLSDLTKPRSEAEILGEVSREAFNLEEKVTRDFLENQANQMDRAAGMRPSGEAEFKDALERVLELLPSFSKGLDLPREAQRLLAMIEDTALRAFDPVPEREEDREARRAEDEAVMRAVYSADDQMHPVLIEAAQLLAQKSRDYGDPDHSKSTYHPFGDVSYVQMLHTKLERIKHLALFSDEPPIFESHRDSVIDLINYAAFYVAWMDDQKKQEARK